jgi:hypothetical protein
LTFYTAPQVVAGIVAFVLAFVGLAFDIQGLSGSGGCIVGNPNLSTFGILFGAIGVIVGVYGLSGESSSPEMTNLNYFSVGLSLASFGIGLSEDVKSCF